MNDELPLPPVPSSSSDDRNLSPVIDQVAAESDTEFRTFEVPIAIFNDVHNPGLYCHDVVTGVVHQDSSALYPDEIPSAGGSGSQQPLSTSFAVPPPPSATENLLQPADFSSQVQDQFLPSGVGNTTVEQALMMPAYMVSTPQLPPYMYGQNLAIQGGANFPPVQHILITIPGSGLPNTSSIISSYPEPGNFQPFFQGIPPTTAFDGNGSLLISTNGIPLGQTGAPSLNHNIFAGGGPLLSGPAGVSFDAMNPGASVRSQKPRRNRKKVGQPKINKTTTKSPTDRRYNSAAISLVAASRNGLKEHHKLIGVSPMDLSLDCDADNLSEYQCFLRKQIEIFEANDDYIQWNAQKMNKGVVLGQVGLRCRHCASQSPWIRCGGSVYYSATLEGLYQSGQNLMKNHLVQCGAVPENIRRELLRLKDGKRRAGGGKHYWAEAARAMGVIEDCDGLRFSGQALENALKGAGAARVH